jgi:hypothetical protein
MIFALETASTQAAAPSGVSEALINDWASRVMDMWEESRGVHDAELNGDLAEACRIRDSLNNRLERSYACSTDCVQRSLRLLKAADDLFRNFTVEATTASALSVHNHYPHRGEWWWRRLLREQSAPAAA